MKEGTETIETERLILRKFKITDASDIFNNYCNSDNVTKYLTWKTHSSIDDTIKYLSNVVLPEYKNSYRYRWAIVLKENNQVIGSIDVTEKNLLTKSVGLGYVLGERFWGQGIMPEAGRAVVKFLFEEGFVRIWAVHDINNLKSGKVMQKIGMKKEGTLRKFIIRSDGYFSDCDIYSIINEDYNNN